MPSPEGGTELREIAPRPPDSERIRRQQPARTTYADLSVLEDTDPDLAAEAWKRIRTEARRLLESGHYAAGSVEGNRAYPYSRALFLALRDDLLQQWAPCGVTERLLIDNFAQAYLLHNRWLAAAQAYEEPPSLDTPDRFPEEPLDDWNDRRRRDEERRREEACHPPPITQREATDRAFELAERFERAMLRAMRALRDLRRFSGPMNINAGQVNIAAGPQQVNVRQAGEGDG